MESQPSLFDPVNKLPDDRHYPTNLHSTTKVGDFLSKDFETSEAFLIITGYSSIEYIAGFFSRMKRNELQKVRIVLGTEPLYQATLKRGNPRNIADSIKEYWLEQRISAIYCWPVLNLRELIRSGKVEFRVLDGLHAKVYIGQSHAMLGSSNFSYNGLNQQKEANVRVGKAEHPEEYHAYRTIAEEYYNLALPGNAIILDILEKLIQYVGWKEVVARAVGELLEGDSVRDGHRIAQIFKNLEPPLWGIQEEAVGQALYVLDNFGSVLIADPTGAGKTRMGVALHLCLKNRMLLNGAMPFEDNTLLITPPIVKEAWANEFINFGSDFNNIMSQGALSGKNEASATLLQRIENSSVIFLDEAHNFLNKASKRSGQLHANQADHLILLTATPINKRIEDIFRLLEIMDIDNLDDGAIRIFEDLYRSARKGKNLTELNKSKLRTYLSQFMVRRTKQEINRRVTGSPERHTLPNGISCRYPKQNPCTYPLYEKEEDILLAREINKATKKLKGLVWLRSLVMVGQEYADEGMQNEFLNRRFVASHALAAYYVQATLRSSNVALIEHVAGTVYAKRYAEETLGYKLGSLKENRETGNMVQKIKGFLNDLPKQNLNIQLPFWLTDPEAYNKACREEIATYLEIADLSSRLSITRENNKVRFLCSLLDEHQLVISFDRNIISLHLLDQIMTRHFSDKKALLVTGNEKSNQKVAQEYFGRGSKVKNWVALCSDVMSEGVNLQQASAVVMLDMPGVMRIAEQRVGRIDRMNSPHDHVYIYFPDDCKEFALRTDRKLYRTATMVEDTIGGNLELPDFQKGEIDVITGAEIAEDYGKAQDEAARAFKDGIQDAFQSVRELVYGDKAIIEEALYNEIRYSKVTLGSFTKPDQASFVKSAYNWAFFCMKGTSQRSPYWVYFEEEGDGSTKRKATCELPAICRELREHVSSAHDIEDITEIARSMPVVMTFFDRLRSYDLQGLPNKKRRGIQLLQELIRFYIKKGKADQERMKILRALAKILEPTSEGQVVDYYLLAKNWIRVIRPFIAAEKKKTFRIIHLGAMREVFKKNPLPTAVFDALLDGLSYIDPADKRVAAYIIGIKG